MSTVSESASGQFLVDEIPKLIFEELSKEFGVESESEVQIEGCIYRVRNIRQRHNSHSMFFPAIGYGVSHEQHSLKVWHTTPKSEDSLSHTPVAEIISGSETLTRCYPVRISHRIRMGYSCGGVDLANPIMLLFARIIERATKLACMPECIKREYEISDVQK